jgi:hypothetical protein
VPVFLVLPVVVRHNGAADEKTGDNGQKDELPVPVPIVFPGFLWLAYIHAPIILSEESGVKR